jgi:CobQ-like glutamine amidotransferase family enzyme
MTSWFTIVRVLPAMLSTNGSGANAEIVAATLRRMGHEVALVDVNHVSDVTATVDMVSIGSGSGSSLAPAAAELIGLVSALSSWKEQGAWFCAVGIGWDLLGQHVITESGDTIPGAGIFPSHADHRPGRFAGEVAGTDYRQRPTAGYLNNVGTSILDDGVSPLWTIEQAAGDYPAAEGLIHENLLATRLGGPALALNPHWRDDIVTGMLASRGLSEKRTDFHHRVDDNAAVARSLIEARLGLVR